MLMNSREHTREESGEHECHDFSSISKRVKDVVERYSPKLKKVGFGDSKMDKGCGKGGVAPVSEKGGDKTGFSPVLEKSIGLMLEKKGCKIGFEKKGN